MFTSCCTCTIFFDVLFNSEVFACCIVNYATISNCCFCSWSCCIINNLTTIFCSICFESITACNLVSQVGQINLSFCTSYTSTCTIIIFQCYRLSSSIIFIAFSCTTSILVYSFTCTVSYSWTNMQFVRFQCFSSVMKVGYVNCCILNIRTSISSCFQFIQVCSSLTCRHCWILVFNSRTNIVNNHATISCTIFTCRNAVSVWIFKGCNDIPTSIFGTIRLVELTIRFFS